MKRPIFRLVYRQVLRGLPGIGSPHSVAAKARAEGGDTAAAADRIVQLHTALGASQGFLFGVPGLLLLPVTLPANLAAAAAVQLHMAATLAALAGLRPEEPAVRERCVACLLRQGPGGPSRDEEEEIVMRTSAKLLERGARWVGGRVVRRGARSALRRVGLRSMPLLGGLIGGGADGWNTQAVGRCAREEFLAESVSGGARVFTDRPLPRE